MKLGDYEFNWVPDEMDIPRPQKTVAVQSNFGNVGYFSWPPLTIGQEVRLKWKFATFAQYEAFKAMYLAGGTHVLDLTPETIYIPPPEEEEPPVHTPYPDPSYPGENPGPPYRRFYIGWVHNAPWPAMRYAYWNNSPIQVVDAPDIDEATVQGINVVFPGSSYLEIGVHVPLELPDFRIGDAIYDDWGSTWAVIVPWDPAARVYYLYPRPPAPTDKIYYSHVEKDAWPLHQADVLNVGDVVYNQYDYSNYRSTISELGTDDHGTWFRCAATPGYQAIVWTAGEVLYTPTGGNPRMFDVEPWGEITGGPFGG